MNIYIYSSQHMKWIKKVNQSCPERRRRTGIVQNSCLTLMKCHYLKLQ